MTTDPNERTAAEELFGLWVQESADQSFGELCAQHPELADELHAVRADWDLARGLLPRPVLDPSSGDARYRLGDELARGGMGSVHEAWDGELRRTVALKYLLGERAPDARAVSRFLEEAQVTGQLEHPGIVPVYDLGIDAERRVFFAMRLVRGRNFQDVIDAVHAEDPDWSATRAVGVLRQVCEAVAFAHHRGVVHRDLKPANVMVGEFGEVYVMDWGLARVRGGLADDPVRTDRREQADRAGDASPLRTAQGSVVGTISYMPPEQAAGQVEELGPPADVYAAGAMLYTLLAGHAPYADVPSATPFELAARVLREPPAPLDRRAPEAPAELVAICERAMRREADERYETMRELAADLSAYLEGRVVAAYESGAWAELKKWVRRNRALASTAAIAILLVVGLSTGGSLVLAGKNADLAEERRQAQANADEAVRQRDAVLRLSARRDYEQLVATAGRLWPPHPEPLERMRDWIRDAEQLVASLDDAGDRRGHRAVLAEIEARIAGRAASQGPEVRSDAWWRETLDALVADLEGLSSDGGFLGATGSPAIGWSVPRRVAMAERLRAGFAEGGEYEGRWLEAAPRILADYDGLELEPQMGLVPLGPDPRSGLWEFWHVPSGEEPVRGGDGELRIAAETGLVLVLIPQGEFWRGAQKDDPEGRNYDERAQPNEAPVQRVGLPAFFLSKYEMTQGQWRRLGLEDPSYYGAEFHFVGGSADVHPVENVDWHDCVRVLARFELLLPTEAQWEYAARGGTDTPWWTGAELESLFDPLAANLADARAAEAHLPVQHPELDDGYPVHAPVATLEPNPFGLHHVCGNIWEWCYDGLVFYGEEPAWFPIAAPQRNDPRIIRGGMYRLPGDMARSATRQALMPSQFNDTTGVRPSRNVD